MTDEIKIILEDYSEKFREYSKYIKSNNWSTIGDVEGFDLENTIVSDMLANLSQFRNEVGDDIYHNKIQEFFKKSIETIDTHINRTSYYLDKYSWAKNSEPIIRELNEKIEILESKNLITNTDKKNIERYKKDLVIVKEGVKNSMLQQSEMFTKTNKIKINVSKLNITTDTEKGTTTSAKIFYSNTKATLYLREFLCKHLPIVKTKVDALNIDFNAPHINPTTSNEFLINMKPKDIPPYDPNKHFFEQPKSTIEFWEEERRKNMKGINIGGYFVHPWLYFHLNSFKIASAEDSDSEPVHPDFRDNEYFFAEMLKDAEEDGKKAILMYGSRRISKALKNSELVYKSKNKAIEIGSVKVGDKILDGEGNLTTVLGVYPQGKVQLYKITLTDGRTIECCIDHIWRLYTEDGLFVTKQLKEFITDYKKYKIPVLETFNRPKLEYIINIEKTTIDEATCIKVDNEDKLFLTTNCIVTHNTTTMSSYVLHKLMTILNASCKVIGFTREPDLDAIIDYISVANLNMHPALNINANNLDFNDGVTLGLKLTPQVRLDYSNLAMVNLEGGTKKSATQKTAGGTPNGFLFDEVGKGACIKPWMSARPSFVKKNGMWRTVPLLSGCVCAGTKVYNHNSELVNIEDLTQEEGILGFNQDLQEVSKEPITWMQPPSEKPCYKIYFDDLNYLECSYEHPILMSNGDFKATEDLSVGDVAIGVSDVKNNVVTLNTIVKIEYIGVKPIYNLTAGATNTYIANGIVTHNTAGEASVSKDAERMLKNPEEFSLMPMNWDLLEKNVDPEWVTWNKNEKFAMFVPAQLSLEAGSKIEKTFAEFLGLPETSPLEKIKIHVTNWEEASTMFKGRREALKMDLDLQSAECNSFPITPEDCYLTPEKNKFPGIKAKNRKELIEKNGEDGQAVRIKKNPYTDIYELMFSDEPLIKEYPYGGGNFDAPPVVLEILEEGHIPPLGLYCMGFDDVKHDTTSGDSVISATIFKRSYEGGEWANRIVAWYDSRPEKKEYYKNLLALVKYYNCRILAENEDNGFLEYLEDLDMRNGTNHVLTHMSEGVGLASEDNLNRNKNRKFGWSPTPTNIYHLENKVVMYTKQDGVVIGNVEDLEGIDLINHPMLLEELYKYKVGQNADRLRSFGLALTLAQYYDKTYQYMVRINHREQNNDKKKKNKVGITKNGLTDTSKLLKF